MDKHRIVGTTPMSGIWVRLILAVAVIATAYYRLALPFLLCSLYLLYLSWSYLWTWAACRYGRAEFLEPKNSLFAGEVFTREYRFYNGWFLPLVRCGVSFFLPGRFECEGNVTVKPLPAQKEEEITVAMEHVYPDWNQFEASFAWLEEGKRARLRLVIEAKARGVYLLPASMLTDGDPSGLFNGLVPVGKEHLLYVYPRPCSTERMLRALSFEDEGRDDIFGLEDRYEYRGVRDYQPGDSARAINWYATARTGGHKTSIYQRKDAQHCLVALDTALGGQYTWSHKPVRAEDPQLEDVVSLAAGIALFYLEQGVRVAFYTNAPQLRWVKPKKPEAGVAGLMLKRDRQIRTLAFAAGSEHGQQILKLCAAVDETGRAYPETQEHLWQEISQVPPNTIVYLLSYHSAPVSWQKSQGNIHIGEAPDPGLFYTPKRLAELSSFRVKHLNLSEVNRH